MYLHGDTLNLRGGVGRFAGFGWLFDRGYVRAIFGDQGFLRHDAEILSDRYKHN